MHFQLKHEEETYNDKRGNVDDDNIGEASSSNVFEVPKSYLYLFHCLNGQCWS